MYQQDKSSESKVKFRQASNLRRKVLEATKLAYANKTKQLSRNLALGTFGKLPTLFSENVNLLYRLYSTARRCCLLHLIKQDSYLQDSGISLPVFPSKTNQKLNNISVTPKMVKKARMNFDLLKVSGPDCIPVVVLKK